MPNTQPVLLKVPSSDVLRRLRDGNHKVSYWQDTPPLDLLSRVIDRLRPARSIGPKIWNEPKFAEKLSPKLLADNRRQNLVDGYPLRWLEEDASYRIWGQGQLLGLDVAQANVLNAFGNLKDRYVNQSRSEVPIDHVLTTQEQELNRFVFLRQEGELTIFAKLDTLEYEFVCKLDRLYETMDAVLETAIADGRVLIVENENKHDWFVAPALWGRKSNSHPQKAYWFLPMAMLDQAWLMDQVGDSKIIKQAKVDHSVGIIEALMKWAQDDGKRLTKKNVADIIMGHIGYSELIFEKAWANPSLEKWKKSGALKANEKIKDFGYNSLNNGRGPKLPKLDYFG